jgi:hypothetical protein
MWSSFFFFVRQMWSRLINGQNVPGSRSLTGCIRGSTGDRCLNFKSQKIKMLLGERVARHVLTSVLILNCQLRFRSANASCRRAQLLPSITPLPPSSCSRRPPRCAWHRRRSHLLSSAASPFPSLRSPIHHDARQHLSQARRTRRRRRCPVP